MKSDSQLLNELAHKNHFLRELTPEESAAMKQALVRMYTDLATLCTQHNLTLILSGGSCLGAVRHQGFIPWDDDLDVMMPRADYEQLILLLRNGALADKYEYSTPNPTTESATVFLKIYHKNSLDIDIFSLNAPFPKGLFIDVFALDVVPNNALLRSVKGFVANALQFCSILTLYASYHNEVVQAYMSLDKGLFRRYRLKCMLGRIVGIIPRRKWLWWFDKFVSASSPMPTDNNRQTCPTLWGIPTGRKYYNGEIFPASVFYPTVSACFEGVTVQIPNGYDAYLRNLYHNYMQLPPVEKRERHFICRFQLPPDNN
ncbi:MAG: LicD family protein [Paludibacter sp.]|nr:LicD family protein [Bacteroidales bacterium]MCM1069881.1 LicD family protein [Prevotella sp.]MCM1354562.1 LicD family protein [Bacteroides sp.]MCM1443457.1 LicD family protein [Muribaculum sp.]MCM1482541.1 LicD family protein [Paludibacter sp.]